MPTADTSWHYSLPDLEVFRRPIDAYRLRHNEMYQHAEKTSDEPPNYLDDKALEGFTKFQYFAEMQSGVLPNCCT